MALVEMIMPKMGESIMEATILEWLKKEGDVVEADESLVEVATDKVDTEVPATHGGILKEILAQEGDVVQVGKPIAIISTDSEEVIETVTPKVSTTKIEDIEPVLDSVDRPISSEPLKNNGSPSVSVTSRNRFYSPLVKSIARQENIALTVLETIPGSGKEGRVTKKDIIAYIETHTATPVSPAVAPVVTSIVPTPSPEPTPISGEDEIIEMDRMRKIIAERMLESKRISAHVTSFVEADVTDLVIWRNKVKDEFKKREGENITFTPIFIDAVIKAIKDFPMINISVDGSKIIKKKAINIGMAVALPSGNLIVPVIKNADQLNLLGLTKRVNDLALRARENKLNPDDLEGGTFTISNVGSFGNVMGTPIIVQPQVGILATGSITKKPSVIETPKGDTIGIRHKMFLSHSYDHRVVDGALGGMFVRKVADYLENFDIDSTI